MILIVYPTVPNVQLRRGGCGDSDIYTGVDSEAAIATGSFIRRSVLAFGTPRVAAYIAVAVTDGRRVSCPSLPFLGRRAVTVAGRGPGARAEMRYCYQAQLAALCSLHSWQWPRTWRLRSESALPVARGYKRPARGCKVDSD